MDFKRNGKRKKWPIVIALLIITNLFSLYLGSMISLPLGRKVMVSNGVLKFQKLFEVKEALQSLYYGDISEDILLEGGIKGMTAALEDPYTVFMNAEEYKSFNTTTEGEYIGLGLQVGVKDDKITVIVAFDNSPAKNAGIISGDVITRVDGKDVTGKDLELAVSMMKGKENEEVTVTFFRESKGLFDVTMKRAKIILETVEGEMLQNNIGYIQISMFDEHTGEHFNNKLKELKDKGMQGLVLDLRGNPGGLLTTCIDVTSNFVPKGQVLVSTKDKYGSEKKYESKGGLAIGMPLVVLTDEGTASASEIFSGVVRDYKLGTIIGTNTFGKGVVQTVVEYKDGSALKVTISKYFTPSGENINKVGIKPDMEVIYPEELKIKPYSREEDPQFNKALEVIKDKLK